jgi:hypothetical protein
MLSKVFFQGLQVFVRKLLMLRKNEKIMDQNELKWAKIYVKRQFFAIYFYIHLYVAILIAF